MIRIKARQLRDYLNLAQEVLSLYNQCRQTYGARFYDIFPNVELENPRPLMELSEELAGLDNDLVISTIQEFPMTIPNLAFLSEISQTNESLVPFRHFDEVPSFVYDDLIQPADALEAAAVIEKLELDIESIESRVSQLAEKQSRGIEDEEERRDIEVRLQKNRNLLRIKRSQLRIMRIWLIDYTRISRHLGTQRALTADVR